MRIFNIVGARPNFIKIAPILRALQHVSGFESVLVHTGQHYDRVMSDLLFEQLGIPEPDHSLNVGSGTHARQTAEVMIRLEELMLADRPDLVMVVGDVNSTLAGALTAAKLNVPVAHVEAGLRSYEISLPEEINRLLTDHLSRFLFVSEPSGMANLEKEGLRKDQQALLVGNVMIDSLQTCLPFIRSQNTTRDLGLDSGEFIVATLHRPSNVDSPEKLERVLSVLREASERGPIVFPAHPRTSANMDRFGLREEFEKIDGIQIITPLGYLEFLNLVDNSRCVLTDSGGLQQETTWLGVPCITLRENTECLICLTHGTNTLTGLSLEKIRAALDAAYSFRRSEYTAPEMWDGHAAERIVNALVQD